MTYITFEREDPTFFKCHHCGALVAHSRAAASIESKMADTQHKIFLRSWFH